MHVKLKAFARGLPTYVYFGKRRSQFERIARLNLWLALRVFAFTFLLYSLLGDLGWPPRKQLLELKLMSGSLYAREMQACEA
jgi:hypothetical protein